MAALKAVAGAALSIASSDVFSAVSIIFEKLELRLLLLRLWLRQNERSLWYDQHHLSRPLVLRITECYWGCTAVLVIFSISLLCLKLGATHIIEEVEDMVTRIVEPYSE